MAEQTLNNRDHAHGHVAFFYATLEERMQLLANYFRDGLERNELCIFATPGSCNQALVDLRDAGLDAQDAFKSGNLRIYEMYETYLPAGKFAADFMLSNVEGFLRDAKTNGHSGLRTAGEMRWVNIYPDFLPDASSYEKSVTSLCAANHDFVGLCMYPLIPESAAVVKEALLSHPAFIYNGQTRINPYAINSDRLIRIEHDDVESLKAMLASV